MSDVPNIGKHLHEIVGDLVVKLAAAHAVIEQLEKDLAEARSRREAGPERGAPTSSAVE